MLLVGIPVMFQLVFTLVIGFLYVQSEREAWKEAQARLLAVRVNAIHQDMWAGGELLFAYSVLHDKAILDKWNKKKAAIVEELDALKKLSIDSEDSKSTYGSMLVLSNRGIEMIERAVSKLTGGLGDVFAEIRPYLSELSKEMDVALVREVEEQSANLIAGYKSRQIIAGLLYASIAADVVIAIALSTFFATSINQRLLIISDNTRRIRERKELNPSVQGTDEIAHLDSQFHQLVGALRESENLRSEFMAMTSHDLKTPLMSVDISLELIRRELEERQSGTVSREIEAAQDNMHRVLLLINDLLDLEKGMSGKLHLELEDLDLAEAVQRAVNAVRPLAERKKITVASEVESVEIVADRRRFDQVLINLLTNAVKFSPQDSLITLQSKDLGSQVEIRVKDQGIGISDADRERIFDRFEQSGTGRLENDYGSGLGLAICRTIMESHGGTIGVDPSTEGGSEFWCRIDKA